MSTLSAQNLSKWYADEEIFDNLSVTIPPGERIALVGANGVGKTTLLQILVGEETPSEGTIHTAKETHTGYLPQNPHLRGDQTIYQEALTAFEDLQRMESELAAWESELGQATPEQLERYGKMQQAFEEAGGYTYEIRIKQVLEGLGFVPADFHRSLDALSGGQKRRVLLARLLLEQPDLLVLDEPTNHLDIDAIEWLEGYLKGFPNAVLMVSHDRYFMDSLVTTVWELDWGILEVYRGNYSHYVRQREERHERRRKEYEAQQAYIQKEQEYIERNIAGQNTSQAKGRRRRLERLMSGTDRHNRPLEETWLLKKPPKRRKMRLKLQAEIQTGSEVLKTHQLEVGYDTPLFSVPDLLLLRGEVAAVIGPNGAGKTSLLKTILGSLDPLHGHAAWGANVQLGYFSQAHEGLNPNNTILDEILTVQDMPISQARNLLAQYLFTGDDVMRQVGTLSGGEQGRLALAKLALQGANVLLLDEPTNHLDIPSQEILQDVLADFDGTILLASHDRYLVDALASQIWHIRGGDMRVFMGTYTDYVQQRSAEQADAQPSAQAAAPESAKTNHKKHGLNPYQRRKRIEELEDIIRRLETELEDIAEELEAASAAGAVDQVTTLGERYSQAEAQLDTALEEWAKLAED